MTSTDPVTRRLRPLQLGQLLQGVAPWVPVEKVFMTELGFTPGLVATMAAGYAAVVPILEIPSGILADRWSRRGVLMLAGAAASASVLVGALAPNVTTYILSALLLGVFFALHSGTVDSIVYDTLLEELGSAEEYEKRFGRIQLVNSLALTASALTGGVIASLTSARLTYVVTVPFAVAGLAVLTRFREPTLHRQPERTPVRAHLAATWRTVAGQPGLATIVLASVLVGASMQVLFEFGPLWLIGVGVATVVFGPYTAAMTAMLGAGGALAGKIRLDGRARAAGVATVLTAGALVMVYGRDGWLVISAQVLMLALLATLGVHLSRLLHDAVPSDLRTGVASTASTLSWLTFLPASVLFGMVSGSAGVAAAGWIIVALVAAVGVTLVRLTPTGSRAAQPDGVVTYA